MGVGRYDWGFCEFVIFIILMDNAEVSSRQCNKIGRFN